MLPMSSGTTLGQISKPFPIIMTYKFYVYVFLYIKKLKIHEK